MDYYKLLNFEKEPFSNTPDPDLFYNSVQHLEALQQLEISIRLKRGLSVVIGDIGTGKTTLSRQLIQKISNDDSIRYYLVLDPGFSNTVNFLKQLLHLFQPKKKYESNDENVLKEIIKKHLFTYGVDNNINIVLIIDEGQKLSLPCMEILRELLNFETNHQKLLQIIIFAQKEFEQSLKQVLNFKDRINFYYQLDPLNFRDSIGLINYRLEKCFLRGKSTTLFTPFGYFLIYQATKGFPRKIVNLCHQIILSMIAQNKSKAGYFFIRTCMTKVFPEKKNTKPIFLSLSFLFVLSVFLYGHYVNQNLYTSFFSSLFPKSQTIEKPMPIPKKNMVNEIIKEIPRQPEFKTDIKVATLEKKPEIITPEILEKPEIYGSLRIPEKSTVVKMIIIVYGSFRKLYLDQIIKYNSNITNLDTVEVSMKINFPVFENPEYLDDKNIFIVLSETNDFEKAFKSAFLHKRPDFDVRILPVWNKDKGYFFHVVIDKPFLTMNDADNYKRSLPGNIFSECKHVSLMKNNTKKNKG